MLGLGTLESGVEWGDVGWRVEERQNMKIPVRQLRIHCKFVRTSMKLKVR